MILPQNKKDEIVQEARELFSSSFGDKTDGACLYWSLCILDVAMRRQMNLIPQAGTAYWRIVPDDLDDGIVKTHFGYEWTAEPPGNSAIIGAMANGSLPLPEIHVWAADPDTMEVIDLSVKYQPGRCKKILKQDWLTALPPDYIWDLGTDLPCGAVYRPNMEATFFAVRLMGEYVRELKR